MSLAHSLFIRTLLFFQAMFNLPFRHWIQVQSQVTFQALRHLHHCFKHYLLIQVEVQVSSMPSSVPSTTQSLKPLRGSRSDMPSSVPSLNPSMKPTAIRHHCYVRDELVKPNLDTSQDWELID